MVTLWLEDKALVVVVIVRGCGSGSGGGQQQPSKSATEAQYDSIMVCSPLRADRPHKSSLGSVVQLYPSLEVGQRSDPLVSCFVMLCTGFVVVVVCVCGWGTYGGLLKW